MASKKEKNLLKGEKPESKETSYPDLGVGWKVRERWTWSNTRSKWQSHKEYISPSGKKFATLKSAQEHIDLIKELGPDWTVEEKWGRKVYHSPSGKEFRSLKQAKAHVATSNTQDVGEVEEKKNDTTGASSSNLLDIQKTYPPAFGSSSTSGSSVYIDRPVNGAKSKKDKQPPKRKRNDTDSNSGSGLSVGNVVLVVKKKRKKKKVSPQHNTVDAVDYEERLRQENKLRCEEQERAETEKQADKRRKEEDKLKREEDAKNRKLKEDRKRKRVEEEEEKRRIETVSWSLICVLPPRLCF